jgi:hypothetical protein
VNADLAPRVARALYALPNSLDQRLMGMVADALEAADSFEDLPEPVQQIVLHSEKYIGPYEGGGDGGAGDADRGGVPGGKAGGAKREAVNDEPS